MVLTKELAFSNVLFDGDCLPIVQAATRRSPVHDALCSIVFDIHRLLDSELKWKVVHASRELNRWANNSANYACSTKIDSIWVEAYPSCIEHIVQEEKLNPTIDE